MKKKKLNARQKRFVAEYLKDHNATQAAIRSGYSRATASQIGYQQLQNPLVFDAFQKAEKSLFKRLQASADRIVAEWTNLGFSDLGDLYWRPGELDSQGQPTRPGSFKPIHEMPPEVRRTIRSLKFDRRGRPEFTLHDKASYHQNLGKRRKLLTDKVDVTIKGSLAERMKAARKRAGK